MAKRIFAKYKVPNMRELEGGLEDKAKFFSMSINEYLNSYIKGIMGDIIESTEKIVREEQRIKKDKQTMDVALSVLGKNKSDEVKKILRNFYNDSLEGMISEVFSKVK